MRSVTLEQVKQAGLLLKREHEERLRLEKEASDFRLEKRAMQVAFKEVELGIAPPFRNYQDLQTKVAHLMSDDLDVREKALEMGLGATASIGTLDDEARGKTKDPLSRWVLDGEI